MLSKVEGRVPRGYVSGNGESVENDEVYVWNHVDDGRIRVAPTAIRYLKDWMTGALASVVLNS